MRVWLVLAGVCTGCGDALPPPAPDAGPVDQRGLVTIQIRPQPGDRLDGHRVFFQDADSSLVLSTRTDRTGQANAFMEPGGFVTLVENRGNSAFIYTYAGVEPGDHLLLDQRFTTNDIIEIELRIPAATGAVSYQLFTSCTDGGGIDVTGAELTPTRITLFGCDVAPNFLVLAFSPGGTRNYLYAADVALSPFGTVDLTGTYRTVESSVVTITGAPPAVDHGFVSQELAGIRLPATFANITLAGGTGSTVVELPRPPGTTVTTRIDLDEGATIGIHRAAVWGPESSLTSIDLGGGVPRYLERPSFERTSQSIAWSEAATGVRPDAVLLGVGWVRFSTSTNYQWMVLAPRGAEPVVRLPIFPDPSLNPAADETPNPFTLVNMAVDGGFARVRARLLGSWTAGEHWPIDGMTGRVIYQELGTGSL